MFVSNNTLGAVKAYFYDRLTPLFSSSELKSMFQQLAIERLQCSSAELLLSGERRMSESDLLFFRAAVKRLQAGEPFQYILGHTEFYGLTVRVDQRVLIPRPETEELVEWVAETFQGRNEISFVDICTGSGCIAMALKQLFPLAAATATDFSTEALDLARHNAKENSLSIDFVLHDALKLAETDLPLSSPSDVWISNPPYIPFREKQQMASHVTDFEPHMALFVPNAEPLCFYEAIAKGAMRQLNPGGWLFVEIHENLSLDVVNLFNTLGFASVEVRKDLQGKDRMIRAMKD